MVIVIFHIYFTDTYGEQVLKCKCKASINLKKKKDKNESEKYFFFLYILYKITLALHYRYFMSCRGWPNCKVSVWFSTAVVDAKISNEDCEKVSYFFRKLNMRYLINVFGYVLSVKM